MVDLTKRSGDASTKYLPRNRFKLVFFASLGDLFGYSQIRSAHRRVDMFRGQNAQLCRENQELRKKLADALGDEDEDE